MTPWPWCGDRGYVMPCSMNNNARLDLVSSHGWWAMRPYCRSQALGGLGGLGIHQKPQNLCSFSMGIPWRFCRLPPVQLEEEKLWELWELWLVDRSGTFWFLITSIAYIWYWYNWHNLLICLWNWFVHEKSSNGNCHAAHISERKHMLGFCR